MQNVYDYYLKAKQKSGKPSLFIWFSAKSDARAKRDLENLIEDAELDLADYFKPVRTNHHVVDDLPPEGEFCAKWCERYELGEDKMTWQLIRVSAAEPEKAKPKTTGEFLASDLDRHTQIAAAWLYGRDGLKLNTEQLKAAKALVMDDAQRYPQNVIMALSSLKEFDQAYPQMPIAAVASIKSVWPPFGKAPELAQLCQFAREYLNAKQDEHADIISRWLTKPGVNGPSSDLPRTKSGAILTNGTEPVAGTPIDSLQMLETVIGCALYPSDFNISNPPAAIIRAVTEMKKRNDKTLKAWYEQLSNTPGVLQFSREAIVVLVRSAEENLHLTPGALRSYINANLIEVNAKTAQQSTEPVQPTASNSCEKEEVGTVSTEFEPDRYKWLRTEILAALNGETDVMSSKDVSELMPKVGDATSHVFLARLLAKEISPCDPFNQLATDEIHHLTCDVLENWVDEKDPRCKFINSRVEFYLQEARRASEQKCQEIAAAIDTTGSITLQQEKPEPTRVETSNEGEKTETALQQQDEIRSLGNGRYDVTKLFETSPLASVKKHEDKQENDGITDDVREFLCASTETADLSGETAQSSSKGTEPDEVPSEDNGDQHRDTPAVAEPTYFEPGRYEGIPNEVYHAANGISSTMVKDARVSLMYFEARHVSKTIQKARSPVLDMGNLVHTLALQPEALDKEFSIEPEIPEGAFTTTATIRAFIDEHNARLPALLGADEIKALLEAHNATLPAQIPLGDDVAQTGDHYMALPPEFQRVEEGQKVTAAKMKACIKEYNATLPAPVKTSGSRDALLEQLAIINPDLVAQEAQKAQPLKVSGTKTDLIQAVKSIKPDAVFADELLDAWRENPEGKVLVTQQQLSTALSIQKALLNHPTAGKLLTHPNRAVEVSYFGIDEETGLEIRVRPDLEIDMGGLRIGADLKTISMWNIKQESLRARLHREIIDRDYHLSAGMYREGASLDQFFWIFVNKDENYHWIAIIEASAELLELGMLEYRKAMRAIANGFDTGEWPAPITEDYSEELNDFDMRRMEALRIA